MNRSSPLLLLAAMSIVAASVNAAPVGIQIVDALRKAHPGASTIRLIGTPTEYALADVYCGKYLTPEGAVSQYAYDVSGVSKGQPAKLLSMARATCERLAQDPAERSYASMMSSLKQDIAEGEARKKEIGKRQRNLENELLDLKIEQVLGRYSDQNVLKMREICFRMYDSYTKGLLLERKAYGSTGYRTSLNTFVLHSVRKRAWNPPTTKQCGFWFAEQLGKHPKALQYAVADFTTYHSVNERDLHNAEMLQLIYATGRGGQHDPSSATAWQAEIKRRRELSGGQ